MAHRTFVDGDGVSWEAWDVFPQMAERRRRERRTPPPLVDADRGERRKAGQRRRSAEARVPVRAGYEHGWLAFSSSMGSRRLAPIPAGWSALPDDELAALCHEARAADRPRPRLIE